MIKRGKRAARQDHGLSGTPTYEAWYSMLRRCDDSENPAFMNYGGRGITVCERWLSYEAFLADVGERPTAKHTLDRYPNNDGHYEPGNVRWATRKEQARNRRSARMVTIDGETRSAIEWAETAGIDPSRILGRLASLRGKAPTLDLLKPLRHGNYHRKT